MMRQVVELHVSNDLVYNHLGSETHQISLFTVGASTLE